MPTIKLTAALTLCLSGMGIQSIAGVCFLLALLDAAQTAPSAANYGNYWLPHFIAILKQFCTARVWPFYLAFWLVVALPQMTGSTDGQQPKLGLAASRGWTGSHQAAANGLCACGKPAGHNSGPSSTKAKPIPAPPTAQEAAQRTESLRQRGKAQQATQPKATALPGLSPNAKPLHPALKPNEAAPVPPALRPAATAKP